MAIERDVLFGSDLKLRSSAAAVDLTPGRSGDLDTATGADNIVQALTLRLLIRKGELARLGFANYGSRLHELIGEPNNQRTRVIAMGLARAAVEQDARVREVRSITANVPPGDRDTIRIEMEVDLITENTPANLVFDVKLGNR